MFNSAEVAERIKTRSKELDMQLKDVFERSGLNKNMMAGMRNGSMPKADNLAKIAEQLDCSVDYLLGRDTQIKKSVPKDGDGLSEEQMEIVKLYAEAPAALRAAALAVLRSAEGQSEAPGEVSKAE